jgi:isoamylase
MRGLSAPLGVTPTPHGANFSIFSKHATGVELLLFDHANDPHPVRTIRFDPAVNRAYHYWHVAVPRVRAGQIYAYRVEGPRDVATGMRFDPTKVLLDPYGRAVVVPSRYSREAARNDGDTVATAMKSVVVDPSGYDWEGDAPLRRPAAQTIVYEMHVRGLTRHPSSGVSEKTRGTFAGVIEKIPYLQRLGITAVELLPVFQFDAQDCPPGLVNYWGYAPVSFFAPHEAYSSRRDPLGPVDEFRDLVKALHRAGIEVILDVVFNHTAEGDHGGPTFSFRGLDNPTYYILETDRARYANYTGTGNTLNANQPIVRRMIVDSLRYWVEAMHVDGFRFDLASILARDEAGAPISNPPVLWDIESDPVLADTKMIAEAWDAAGLYQVGSFVGDSWKEWNGRFRDDARSFFRGDTGSAARFADRLIGSPEIFRHEEREPEQSVNFVTCHDGFTLNDLVSYERKHNEANGEGNRDGANDNRSWNCGVEGPTDDPAVEKLRNRQVEEPSGRHAPVAGHADAPDGRRDAAHPARQQQRLLPGQRDELGRLVAAREARRRAPVRDPAQRAAASQRLAARAPAFDTARADRGSGQGVARRQASSTGLAGLLPHPRFDRRGVARTSPGPPDPECVRGATRIRAATAGQ